MENLEDIKSRITDLVSERVNLKNEMEEKTNELMDICRNNYDNILAPVIRELSELDKFISDKTGTEVSECKGNIHKLEFSFEGHDFYLYFCPEKYAASGVKIFACGNKNMNLTHYGSYQTEVRGFFHILFYSIENINFLTDKVKEHFSERFMVYEKQINNQCSELKKTIAKLSEMIKSSSTLTTSDDGNTIELTINGKKYVGKLEEQ
jgi:hypothetical protein